MRTLEALTWLVVASVRRLPSGGLPRSESVPRGSAPSIAAQRVRSGDRHLVAVGRAVRHLDRGGLATQQLAARNRDAKHADERARQARRLLEVAQRAVTASGFVGRLEPGGRG